MKKRRTNFKHILTTILFAFSFSTFATDLPDPEVLAKQYLKDLCTLNEQDFTRKYMLMQEDVGFVINQMILEYKKMNSEMPGKLSDSLSMRSKIHKVVVRSYETFKEWQHTNKIDSSKIVYHSCEFKLEKKRDVPFYIIDRAKIYFTVDTLNYVIVCENFAFVKNKWIAGDLDEINPLNKSFDVISDSTAKYNESDYTSEEHTSTKKQIKIQKKIEAHNRKIDALYNKKYELI